MVPKLLYVKNKHQTSHYPLCAIRNDMAANNSIQVYHLILYHHTQSLCTWWLQQRKLQVMFKVSPTSLQIFIDTMNCALKDRVQYSTVHIPNVFCDSHLQIINCVGIVQIHNFCVFFCTVIIMCTETLWLPCIIIQKVL
jgi:hypothetical protein